MDTDGVRDAGKKGNKRAERDTEKLRAAGQGLPQRGRRGEGKGARSASAAPGVHPTAPRRHAGILTLPVRAVSGSGRPLQTLGLAASPSPPLTQSAVLGMFADLGQAGQEQKHRCAAKRPPGRRANVCVRLQKRACRSAE